MASGLFLFLAFATAIFGHSIVGSIFVWIICSFVAVLQKFTSRISIDSSFIEIEYSIFFQQKRRSFPLRGSKASVYKRYTRGGSYWALKITSNVENSYTIDSRDGFTKDKLQSVCDYINTASGS
jgi:hypothetical protein